VFSVCMAKDPICNLTVTALASCKLHSASCPHLHYADRVNTNWGETYTKFLGDEITIVLFGTCPPIAGKRTPAAVGGLSAPDAIAKGC